MNTRAKGRELENYVAAVLGEIDPKARPTVGSGGVREIADILNKYFFVECKKRNTKSVTIKEDVWIKLCGEIPVGSLKIPLYILANENNVRWAVLELKDLIRILGEIYGKTKKGR